MGEVKEGSQKAFLINEVYDMDWSHGKDIGHLFGPTSFTVVPIEVCLFLKVDGFDSEISVGGVEAEQH